MTALQTSSILRHTPGPYQYCRDTDGVDDQWNIQSLATGQHVATIVFWGCTPEWADRALADACLLSAAPELLHALKRMLEVIADAPAGEPADIHQVEQLAIAAIAKAEGR